MCQKPAVVALYSVLCWGFPLVLTIVLARLYLLGYAETVDLGNQLIKLNSLLCNACIDLWYFISFSRLVLYFFHL